MLRKWIVVTGLVVFGLVLSGKRLSQPPLWIASPALRPASPIALLQQLPLYFVANQGQLDEQVIYYLQGHNSTLYFTSQGVTFALLGDAQPELSAPRADDGSKGFTIPETQTTPQRWAVKLDFVNANPAVKPVGDYPTPARVSYFKGAQKNWQTDLPTYSRVVYSDLWPGIDLVYAGTTSQLKYEFVVHPGADPTQIQLRYRGATAVTQNEIGQLVVEMPAGGFVDDKPYAYQTIGRDDTEVRAAFALNEEQQTYTFALGDYDTSRALVIDPAILIYAGYIGGANNDESKDISVDEAGNIYVTGATGSSQATFPVTVGPDLTYNSGTWDAFIAKVNASGTALVYAGYIGGNGDEFGREVVVDAVGNAYISGQTDSTETTFPVTVGPDLIYNGGTSDAFVAKVNATGTALVYAGYIGGNGSETSYGLAVDGPGNAYVVGQTDSAQGTFPETVGPDLTWNGGDDAFVVKVNSTGTTLVYAGYIGGASNDAAYAVEVDAAGKAYITGETASDQTTFPVSVGPDLIYNGGTSDAFVAQVNLAGTALIYAGYVGGDGNDHAWGLDIDEEGNLYLVGHTNSTQATFPEVVGPDLAYNGGTADAYVAKVNATGTALLYAGYIGGSSEDLAFGIAVDGAGYAHIVGQTSSDENSFPVIGGPDLIYNGGAYDTFIAKLNPAGTTFGYVSYLGGTGDDLSAAVAIDNAGNAYAVGTTTSNQASFPVVVGPDLIHNGGEDVFVAKIADTSTADLRVSVADSPDPVGVNQNLTYTLVITNNALSAATATGVVLTSTWAGNVNFISANPSQGNCNGASTVVCNLGSMSTSTAATVTIVVQPVLGGVITNTVSVAGNQSDPTPANNTAVQTTTINGTPPTPTFTPTPSVTPTHTPTPTTTPQVARALYLPLVSRFSFFAGPLEAEDNDTSAQANGFLYPGQVYLGYPNDRDDYFSFYAGTSGTITVNLTNTGVSDVQLHLYYQIADPPHRVGYAGGAPYAIDYSGAPGLYYVRVLTASGQNSAVLYNLLVTYP